jgi:methyltransferase family protein
VIPGDLSAAQRTRLEGRGAFRFSTFDDVNLPPLPALPGMVSPVECRYLYWLTSRGYAGAGAVVEVGTWLGLSTIHLAAGLAAAGHHAALTCYDQFVWHRSYGRSAALPLRRGDDFQPHFEANVRPVYPGLVVRKAALDAIAWTDGPIEILFLDAPKHLVDMSTALAAFSSWLEPGLSLVVMQDYMHPPAFALPAVISCLGDALEPVHIVDGGSTVAFRVLRRIDFSRAQPVEWNYTRWSPDEVAAHWRRVTDPLPLEVRARLQVGAALLLHRRHETRAAQALIAAIAADPGLRPSLERDAGALLYADYPALFRAAGLPPPPPGSRRSRGIRAAIRRTRATARRWLRGESTTETIG